MPRSLQRTDSGSIATSNTADYAPRDGSQVQRVPYAWPPSRLALSTLDEPLAVLRWVLSWLARNPIQFCCVMDGAVVDTSLVEAWRAEC